MTSRRIGSFLINPGNSNATQFITTLNDGAGSGFDADLLDGQHGSYYAPKASPAFTGTPTAPTASAGTNTTQLATTAFVSTAVSNLVDSAPGTLDTLNELAAALGDDSNFSTTVTNSIATKLSLSGGTMTGNIAFSGAQTVDGRDLSADGSKLDGIAAGAEVNVQSDWNATSGDALILNKPTIPTNNNQLTNGAGYITSSGSITGSAGTLDGLDSTQFLRSDAADTAAGVITFTARPIVNTGATESGIRFRGASLDFVGRYSNYISLFNQLNTSREIKIPDSGDVTIGGNVVYHTGNDGAGSGLDADLLDGQQGSYYLNYNNLSNKPTIPTNNNQLTNADGYITSSGSITGSAGTLDGLDSTQFLRSDTADTATGTITFDSGANVVINSNIGANSATAFASMTGRLEFDTDYSDTARGANKILLYYDSNAWMAGFGVHNSTVSYYSGADHAWYKSNSSTSFTERMRLSSAGLLTVGGNTVWNAGNDGSGSGLDADLLDGQQGSYYLNYNNLSNKPTIPTNNNQLTNGAGYITSSGSITGSAGTLDGLDSTQFLRSDADDSTSGYLQAEGFVGSGGALRIANPGGASFATTAATTTGYLKITLPVSWTNTMLRFTVKCYEYATGESFEIHCGGYNYTNTWANNPFAYIIGDPSLTGGRNFNVRFGHDGTKCAIYIGESNSTWSYFQFGVTEFLAGYSSFDASSWHNGWSCSITTTLGTITATQTANAVGEYVKGNTTWHAGNDGAGSGLDADLLDGLQPSVSASNNTIVQRHSSGYIYANYFNTTPNDVTSGVTKVCVETGNDGFIRHGDAAAIRTFIGAGSGGGLDADLLDGQQGSYYLNYNNLSNKPTIPTNNNQLTNGAGYITSSGSITGNAATATTFSTSRTNYKGVTDGAVSGQLMWKNYGNNHTIFDASNSTSPSGTSVNNTNPSVSWSATYPTLMGWNGSNTYGVRVDRAKVAESINGYSGTIWTSANDGAGSGLDADLLDGLSSGSFFRADAGNSVDARIAAADGRGIRFWDSDSYKIWMSHSGNATWGGRLDSTSDYNMYFRMTGGTNRGFVFKNSTTNVFQIESDGQVRLASNNIYAGNANIVWHAGNDGSGSGLDADTLDGVHGASYLRSDADNLGTGSIRTSSFVESGVGSGSVALTINDGYGNANIAFNHRSGVPDVTGSSGRIECGVDLTTAGMWFELGDSSTANTARSLTTVMELTTGNISLLKNTSVTGTLQISGNTAWHAGNDGAGSGLDADLLDGISSASFLRGDVDDTFTRLSGTRVSCGFDSGNDNSVGCSNWFRSSGSTGWYNQTYGGGWFMQDTTWIRTFNNKSIYQNSGTLRTDGTLQVGNAGATLDAANGSAVILRGGANTAVPAVIERTSASTDQVSIQFTATNTRYLGKATDNDPYWSTASDITGSGTKIWHAGNDGSGSGLDADLLDGLNAATTGANTIVRTDASGNIAASGNVTAYSSDRRLKENFNHIDSPVEKVQKLNGYTFDWNEKSKELGFTPKHEKNDIGLIAQEVEDILPQAVAPAPFDTKSNGESKSRENYLTIQYERLVPLLVEAIKEQQNQINKLTQEIEQLKK